ncbi:uncharacterized protein LOC135378695 isoform X4 [Ornithodoros turicata]|uniref:uncharacterized protein LOC135378695 isoform X4 n=1 Tax=Ornithodoros turicata TaxID=34597 RepID=UPI00313A37BC
MFTSAAFNPVIYRPVMHAYVCYVQDDVRAIVPVSLIRNSRPPSETDYDSSHRMVYWCSTKGDGSDEEYYQAEILDLAGSKAAMILKIKSQKLPIPRIFHCSKDYHPASDKKKSGSDTRKAKESAKKQRLRDMASCSVQGGRAVKKGYGKRNRSCSGDDSTSSDESVVPQHLLVEKDATIARLRKRLREKQEKTSRLTLALLDKIEVARQVAAEAAPQPAWPLDARQTFAPPHESRAEVSQNICPQDVSLHEDVVQHALVSGYFLISQTSSCFTDKECLGLQDDSDALPIITVDQGTACPVDSTRAPPMFTGSSASTSGALARPACTVQPGEMRPSPTRELQLEQIQYEMYSVVDSKVRLGDGHFIPMDKFAYIQRGTTDSKLVKDLARYFWTTEELGTRNMTGQPCRRPGITTSVKAPATPAKVQAIANGLSKYIADHPSDVPKDTRLKCVRRTLSDFFADVARQGRRRK